MDNPDSNYYYDTYFNNKTNTYKYLNVYIPYNEALFPDSDSYNSFIECYMKHIDAHNHKIANSVYKDAGFDIINPASVNLEFTLGQLSKLLNLGINCSMYAFNNDDIVPVSYFLFPRSSTGKTNIRLANSAGIIDSGYRGNIMACVESAYGAHPNQEVLKFITITKGDRLFQLCAGDLTPILVKLVKTKPCLDIMASSERGTGGFGSTGTSVAI